MRKKDKMTLKQYMFNFGITSIQMAYMLDISLPYMSIISNGKKKPSEKLAIKIQDLTDGRVCKESLLFVNEENDTPHMYWSHPFH